MKPQHTIDDNESTSQPTIYFDYDRTLFDTERFSNAVWRLLAERAGIDRAAEEATAQDFFVYNQDLYHYDFFRHLKSIGLDSEALISWLAGKLKNEHLLLPGAADALQRIRGRFENVEILTYGEQRYQWLKLQSCPETEGCKWNVVLEPKSVFLAGFHKPSVLVDDKLLAGQIPAHVKFIHLDRSQAEPVVAHEAPVYTSIDSLSRLQEVV